MQQKKRPRPKADGKRAAARKIVKEQALCVLAYLVLFLAAAAIAFAMNLSPEKAFYAAVVALAVAAFLVALANAKKAQKNGLFTGLRCTAPSSLLAILASVAANGFHVDLRLCISLCILLLCAMLGGMVGVNLKSKPKFKAKKGRAR